MIVNENLSSVERNGLVQEGAFTIKASAKAFKILSDGLYSNKILAIVRELSCNAHDSHVAAGKKGVPFLVHLPNEVEPYFSVRDYGIGLSHENVMTLYTTYFESTKTDSNDFIGALGLGSKSPFSYTDSFTVTSFFAGKRKVYNAFLNEHGVPSIALLLEEDSTEENGLEVKLAIKAANFREFSTEAQTVFNYFEPIPKIVGIDPQLINGIKKPEYILEGNGWGIRKYTSGGARAIQGQVAYTIPNQYNSAFEHFDDEKTLLNLHIDIYFDIGELEVAASREQLSFDNRTIRNLQTKLIEIKNILGDIAAKEISKEKTLWNAARKYKELSSAFSITTYLPKVHENKFVTYLADKGSNLKVDFNSYKKDIPVVLFEYIRKTHPCVYGPSEGQTHTYNISPSDKKTIIIDDLPRGLPSRIKHNYLSHITYVVIRSEKKKLVNQVLKDLGSPPYILASTLPVAPKADRKSKEQSYVFDKETGEVDINPKIVDFSKPGIFVYKNGKNIYKTYSEEGYSNRESSYDLRRLLNLAKKLKLIGDTVVIHALTGSFHSKLEHKDKWINIYELAGNIFKKRAHKPEWSELLKKQEAITKFEGTLSYEVKNSFTDQLMHIDHELFKKFKETYNLAVKHRPNSYSTDTQLLRDIKDMEGLLGLTLQDVFKDVDKDFGLELLNIIKEIETKYPLVKYCYSSIRYDKASLIPITEYITMVDNK